MREREGERDVSEREMQGRERCEGEREKDAREREM
jgi:hypothetical protein